MALTHTQRTSMFNTLTEVMGQDDAETLMEHLPASGWNNVATKDDLRAAFAETNAAIATGLAQASVERADGFAQAAVERAEGLAQAAAERTAIIKAMTDGFAQAAVERAEIRTEAALGRAEIMRRQAWHLYIAVSTIVVAAVPIWIGLLTQAGAG